MFRPVFLFSLITLFAACKPQYELSQPEEFKFQTKGLYLKMQNADYSDLTGEIIAVSDSQIILLPVDHNGEGAVSLPKGFIKDADILIAGTSNSPTGLGIWGGILPLTTLGHGYYLQYSFPVNLFLILPIGIDAEEGEYRLRYPEELDWEDMAKFARFPQGMPQGIDKSMIR